MIVPEVLNKDNYENWSDVMESYMRSHDLWDVVTGNKTPEEERTKKNAKAMLAI